MSADFQTGADVAFADIEAALAAGNERGAVATPPRASTASIVAVGPDERVAVEAAAPLQHLAESGSVRAIVIAHGASARSRARVGASFVALEGIPPEFVDNAVAAIRLSSLPTLVWWRGGPIEALDRVADLADRIVFDVNAPEDLWPYVATILHRTACSDLRWTRLTRWRALTAQFFDIPAIASAASSFTRLRVEGADRATGRLFSAWLKSSLHWQDSVQIEIVDSGRDAPIEAVTLSGNGIELRVCLAGSRRCIETSLSAPGLPATSRVVSLGSQSLVSLLSEELRIRSRDVAFERALLECVAS